MKKLLLLSLIFIGFSVNAQVGIGTDMPNPSSQLEIVANDRGILIPQVSLLSITDQTTITNGNVESLLVFNTSTTEALTPGYYYWYNGSWKRISSSNNSNPNIPENIVIWNSENEEFVYLNEEGDNVRIDLGEIANENITTLVDNIDGTYTYTSEDNTVTTINVPADVIGNINNNGNIYERIIDLIKANTFNTKITDNGNGTFTHTAVDGTEVIFDANTTNLLDNGDGTYDLTNADGNTININTNADSNAYDNTNSGLTAGNVQDALDEIQDNLDNTSDILVDNTDGTYTHTAVDGTEVIIDANTTSVSEVDGVYTFTDGNGDAITSIDTNADAINFDNSTNGFTSDNVQAALEEVQASLDDTDTGLENIDLTDNGDGTFTYSDAAGTAIDFDANTTSYAQDGAGNYTFTNHNGESMTVTVIDDVVANIQNEGAIYNEIINILGDETDAFVDNRNGTFTHTAVDGTEVIFDANTTNLLDNGDGTYDLTNADGNTININTNADSNAYDNTNSGLTAGNVQDALDEIQDNLDNTSDILVDNTDGTYTHTAVDGTEVIIDANTTSVTENADGSYTFTDATGTEITTIETAADTNLYDNTNSGLTAGNVQDALDEIQDNLDNTSDILVDNTDGTYTHTAVDGTEVIIDANTTSVTENADGSYTFTDATGTEITTIETAADTNLYDNTNSGLTAGNVQDALDEIQDNLDNTSDILVDNTDGTYTHTAVDGTEVIIDANTTSVSEVDGVYTFTDGNGDTITSIDTNAGAIAFDNSANGFTSDNVQAALEEIQDNLDKTSDILVDNTDGTYTHTAVDGTEVIIDANTTSVTENADGSYTFTDATGTEITTIETAADTNLYDNTNSGLTAGNVQDALDEIQDNLDNTSDILVDNTDGTYTHTAVDGTEVIIDANTTSVTENADGSYTFTDATGTEITTIETAADTNLYDNTNSGLTAGNVQDALDEIQDNLDNTSDILVDNTDGTYTHTAVDGTEVIIDANTTSVTENADGSYTFTDATGTEITTIETAADTNLYDNTNSGLTAGNVQDALDEIQDNLDNTSDILVDNTDGTYTHTAVDGTEVIIDANTTSVSEVDGVYTFIDGNGDTITSIDTNADAINFDNSANGFTSDNVQSALEEIQDNLDNTSDILVDNTDGTYTHTAVDGTEVIIDANTTSVTENADGSYTFKDATGTEITTIETAADTNLYDNTNSGLTAGNVQDALDEIQDNLDNTSDILVDNTDGTYTHTAVDGTEVIIDANTTSVTENADGSYTFTDATGTEITTIETSADTNLYDNTNSGLTAGNVQDALDEIQDNLDNTSDILVDNTDGTYTHTAVDGTEVIIDANTTSVTENANGSYTFTDATGTEITTIETAADTNLYDNTNSGLTAGNVQDALDEIQDNLDNTSDILVDNTDGTYTHTAVDGTEVIIDANTTSVTENADGSYTFTDATGTEITTIETAADTNLYDNTNSGLTSDNVQDALDEIQGNLDGASDGAILSDDLTVTDGENSIFKDVTLEIAPGAVGTDELANDAVTNIKLANNSVSNSKVQDGAITSAKIQNGEVNEVDINTDAVSTDKIQAGAVSAEKLGSDGVPAGQVPIADGAGNVTYGNVSSSSVDGEDFTSNDLTITNGTGATLTAVTAEISDGAVDTDALGADAVTNEKLSDDAVDTENIVDGGVGTSDLAGNSVTADKLNSGSATSGQVGIADGAGNVTYGNVSSTSVDGEDLSVSDGIEFTGGTDGVGKLLAETGIGIADGGITTDKLATNAVTNEKLSDDSVNTENIVDGGVGTSDLAGNSVTADKLNSGSATSGQVGIADGSGNVTYGNISSENVDGADLTAGDGSITVVDGTGATLVDANVSVAADGITNDKLADDAVSTENILDGGVGTSDLAGISVTADKLNSGSATSGQVPIADGAGNVTYGNISSSRVDGEDFTSNDLTITNGIGATLTAVTAEISDGAVDTDALGADAVTNDKLSDDAVDTENIVDGGVGTSDLAGNSVTADKLNSGSATSGQVGIADGSGNVTYGNISSENVDGADLTAGDGSITVVDGTGATLVEANLRVAADGITNDKLADNAVNTENIVDGAIEASDINSNVAGDGLTQNTTTGALEVSANNGVTATTDNIQLGGDLIQPTAITTDATNTLAVEGLQDGSATDNIVVADPNTGELKQLKAAMPKFFYMPSVVFDTSTQDTGITRNLHQDYVDQFGSPVVSSSGASGAIPTLDANDLEYYITYYDDTVFENVSIDAVGNLTYDVISSTNSAASFMNIVFVVK